MHKFDTYYMRGSNKTIFITGSVVKLGPLVQHSLSLIFHLSPGAALAAPVGRGSLVHAVCGYKVMGEFSHYIFIDKDAIYVCSEDPQFALY